MDHYTSVQSAHIFGSHTNTKSSFGPSKSIIETGPAHGRVTRLNPAFKAKDSWGDILWVNDLFRNVKNKYLTNKKNLSGPVSKLGIGFAEQTNNGHYTSVQSAHIFGYQTNAKPSFGLGPSKSIIETDPAHGGVTLLNPTSRLKTPKLGYSRPTFRYWTKQTQTRTSDPKFSIPHRTASRYFFGFTAI